MTRLRIALICAVVAVLGFSIPALALDPNHVQTKNTPIWGYGAVDELLQKVGPEIVVKSGCLAAVLPIKQGRTAEGKYQVSSGLRLTCEESGRAFSNVHWEVKAMAGDVILFEDGDTDVRPENPWNPIGGTQKLSNFSLPCKTVNPRDRGKVGQIQVTAFLSVTDTEGNYYKTTKNYLTDSDSVVCPDPLRK